MIYSFRLFKVNILSGVFKDGVGWIRIFGKGIHWKDTTKHRLVFSERNSYRKSFNICKYRLSILK